MTLREDRRRFLANSAAVFSGAAIVPYFFSSAAITHAQPTSKNDRLGIGAVGLRYQGSVITYQAAAYGDVVAIADVDRNVRDTAKAAFGSRALAFEDYRKLLERKDVDVVMIGTPDHWHAKMVVDACRAGKDVYVEKPLTLTIDEGKIIRRVARETGRVVQVGSWQRSDHRFRLAVELVRHGRLGKLRRVTATTDKNPQGGPFKPREVPSHLNWDLWQGQTPAVPYIEQRSHYTFRWWSEYAGGKMTDWGAHHIDIAQWGIGTDPIEIHGVAKYPTIQNGYNVPTDFKGRLVYPDDVELIVEDSGRNGILFEGEKGRIFVNRGVLAGKPVDALKDDPLPRESFSLYDYDNLDRPERVGKLDAITNHMGNFFDCVRARRQPISDVESQHRSATTCHLANIAMRVGRPIQWDASQEQIVGDPVAGAMLSRAQRKGYEVA